MIRTATTFLIAASVLSASTHRASAAEFSPGRRADQAALKAFAPLIGPWKGVGQPQRGSSRGAWTEAADWAWKLSNDSAALELKVDKGKYLKAAELRPGTESGTFALKATLADGSTRTFAGKADDHAKLVLAVTEPGAEGVRRITLTPLHETRFLMMLEGADAAYRTTRLGEVGYTRQGVAFAAGESGPVCIVTEGRGTMTVAYKGKSYYVCCSGCRDLFKEDPEAVLAEAKEREKAKK